MLYAGAFYTHGLLEPQYNLVSTHGAIPVQQDKSKAEARLRQENGPTKGFSNEAGFY